MKIVRYILFCILVLIISILLRRPPDLSKGQWGIANWAVVEWVTGLFSGDDTSDEDGDDTEATDRAGGDEEDEE
jgi:hypothetical protein